MSSHDIDLEIKGEGVQLAEITLDPNETVIAEAGAMVYAEDGVSYEAKMGDGSNPDSGAMNKIFSAGKRMIAGESLFLTHFTNNSNQKRQVGFAGNIPGSVVGIDLSKIGGSLTCQRDAFLCAAYGTEVTVAFTKRLGTGFFGGEGFILQKAKGDGKLVLHVGGKVIKKQLNNETLRVDAGCLVAFTDGIDYDIAMAGNVKSMLFGGEGLFFATLRGTGTVLLQSTPASKMSQTLLKNLPSNTGTGNKSIGNVGNILDRLT
jgi:uncharacterized protein (TIGR00266 family)